MSEPNATEAVTDLILKYEDRLDRLRKSLVRIMDVAERYQENKANRACAGLGNCYRFARAALEKESFNFIPATEPSKPICIVCNEPIDAPKNGCSFCDFAREPANA